MLCYSVGRVSPRIPAPRRPYHITEERRFCSMGKTHPKFIDHKGQVFGRLTVIKRMPNHPITHHTQWLCRCTCSKKVVVLAQSLRRGLSQSCGCWAREKTSARSTTHGMSQSPEYSVWCGMLDRCYNPRNNAFSRYGGRGIDVCEKWLDFAQFFADMGPRPGPEFTIERLNVNLGYFPANTTWADRPTQSRNKRNNIHVTMNGQTKILKDWAKIMGLPYGTVHRRIKHLGWSAQEALTRPLRKKSST